MNIGKLRIIPLTAIALVMSFSVYSQENKSKKGTQENKYETWSLEKCQNHLKKIEEKAEYIRSNEGELKHAKENNWFEKTEKMKQKIQARIEAIEKK